MDIPDFKTCKVIKIEFNKQIMDRCDSKIDFRESKAPLETEVFRGSRASMGFESFRG